MLLDYDAQRGGCVDTRPCGEFDRIKKEFFKLIFTLAST